jgi:SPASM domain peptide maturase of grasp-with-spasm system
MMKSKDLFFILSASCKLVRGYKRSVIIDYVRGDLYFITHEYHSLVDKLDRKKIICIEKELEDIDSRNHLKEFIKFLLDNEIGFLAEDSNRFPKISDSNEDELVLLQDVIIEIDESCYIEAEFIKLCDELTMLNCTDFQIRLLSEFNPNFIEQILRTIDTTSANYLEVHCTYNELTQINLLHGFVERNTIISKLFIYDSPFINEYPVINEIPDYYPISLGTVFFVDYPFDDGSCCGIITFKSLTFKSYNLHNKLKSKNGCLDKKIAIDRYGNVKNCPSMTKKYGNIKNTTIKDVITNTNFNKYWFLNKDQISICKDCEFRYNCSDCRAFIQDTNNIFSKPSKCSYNPYTCEW